MKIPKAQISISIDRDILEKLKAEAVTEFRSLSQHINYILRCYIRSFEVPDE